LRKALPYTVLSMLAMAAISYASSIKTWSTNERLRSSDLNTVLAHLHDSMVGNGHSLLLNADVSGSAAIAHSKLATPALVAKAWGGTSTVCTTGTCSLSQSSKVTSVTWNATGIYHVTLAYTPGSTSFVVVTSCPNATAGTHCNCNSYTPAVASPHFKIQCYSAASGAAPATANNNFSFVVYDTANY
jgi:hypothetical protein